MTLLPFKFFFLKHRKPFTLVILVSFTEIPRKIWQFLRKLWQFLKLDSTVQCDCHVMSHHGADKDACFALIGWSIIFLNLIGWKQTIQFFLNLDTCIVFIVKVSNGTIQLIINNYWTVGQIIAWSILLPTPETYRETGSVHPKRSQKAMLQHVKQKN